MPNGARNEVVISGLGVHAGLGQTGPALFRAIERGARAPTIPFFGDDDVAAVAGLAFDPLHVPAPPVSVCDPGRVPNGAQRGIAQVQVVLDEALADAGLTVESLAASRTSAYVGGPGVQPELARFVGYRFRNDREDLISYPGIREQHADNYRQGMMSRWLLDHYKLSRPPISLYSASCSSLSALYLAANAVSLGIADVALVVTWQLVQLDDLVFMAGLDALSRAFGQPFGLCAGGVVLGCGAAAVVVENREHLERRGGRGRARLRAVTTCQTGSSARGGSTFAPDFRSIAETMTAALERADLAPEHISCLFPHGNGLRSSDKAEAMAIKKALGERAVPAVSYKGQLGYLLAASGLVDLAILIDALQQGRLMGFNCAAPLDEGYGLDLHTGTAPRPLRSDHGLKVGLGIDGSVVACAVTAVRP